MAPVRSVTRTPTPCRRRRLAPEPGWSAVRWWPTTPRPPGGRSRPRSRRPTWSAYPARCRVGAHDHVKPALATLRVEESGPWRSSLGSRRGSACSVSGSCSACRATQSRPWSPSTCSSVRRCEPGWDRPHGRRTHAVSSVPSSASPDATPVSSITVRGVRDRPPRRASAGARPGAAVPPRGSRRRLARGADQVAGLAHPHLDAHAEAFALIEAGEGAVGPGERVPIEILL